MLLDHYTGSLISKQHWAQCVKGRAEIKVADQFLNLLHTLSPMHTQCSSHVPNQFDTTTSHHFMPVTVQASNPCSGANNAYRDASLVVAPFGVVLVSTSACAPAATRQVTLCSAFLSSDRHERLLATLDMMPVTDILFACSCYPILLLLLLVS